jgi:radical SAM superfamily enzyme YgiQ (UPF0313 family)
MRIALVNPIQRTGQGYHSIGSKIPHLGLQVVAECTPKQHHVDIYDEIFGSDKTEEYIIKGKYDLVGITAYTSGAVRAYELAKAFRKAGLKTVFGGIHATTCPDEAQPFFDSIVMGEADEIWAKVVDDFEKGQMQARYTADRLPELELGVGRAKQGVDPVNGRYDVASIQTSRGCPTGCKFCSVTKVNGARIRRRQIDDIIAEWNAMSKPFVFITDDNFFGVSSKQAEWTKELMRQMIKRGKRRLWFTQTTINMGEDIEALELAYKAGCRAMFVGLESFDEQNLLEYQKGLNRRSLDRYKEFIDNFHKAGLAVFGAVIFGADNDRPETLMSAATTAVNLGVDIIQVTNLTPLPGTGLYEELQKSDRILANNYPEDWEKYTFIHTVIKPGKMTAQEMDEATFLFRRAACERPWVLKRTLKSLWKTKSLTTALFVHGMNKGFRRVAAGQVREDAKRFPHLLKVPIKHFPD